MDIRIADPVVVRDWPPVTMQEGNKEENILIGETEVTDHFIPDYILFRSNAGNPGLVFDWIMLIRR